MYKLLVFVSILTHPSLDNVLFFLIQRCLQLHSAGNTNPALSETLSMDWGQDMPLWLQTSHVSRDQQHLLRGSSDISVPHPAGMWPLEEA